jgi:hypothetical protein
MPTPTRMITIRTRVKVKTAAITGRVPELRRHEGLEEAGSMLRGPGADAVIDTW